ncbi:MAG TPA: alkaline phosphatase family protein, partial [Polyangiaceae bacterium]
MRKHTMLGSSLILGTTLAACGSNRNPTNYAPPIEAGTPEAAAQEASAPHGLQKVKHVVVVVLENWSFDSLYGEFDGADGISALTSQIPQVDSATGQPYSTLPQVDPALPANLPNAPFALDPFISLAADTSEDLV